MKRKAKINVHRSAVAMSQTLKIEKEVRLKEHHHRKEIGYGFRIVGLNRCRQEKNIDEQITEKDKDG